MMKRLQKDTSLNSKKKFCFIVRLSATPEGCMTLQSQFEQIVNFNSMENCITIASACNAAYRKKWMPEEKIAVEPIRGWRPAHNQSHIALH